MKWGETLASVLALVLLLCSPSEWACTERVATWEPTQTRVSRQSLRPFVPSLGHLHPRVPRCGCNLHRRSTYPPRTLVPFSWSCTHDSNAVVLGCPGIPTCGSWGAPSALLRSRRWFRRAGLRSRPRARLEVRLGRYSDEGVSATAAATSGRQLGQSRRRTRQRRGPSGTRTGRVSLI